MERVYTPGTVEEAIKLLSSGCAKPVAGCTNYLVDRHKGKIGGQDIVSLDKLKELCGIQEEADCIQIGSLVTFAQIECEQRLPACLRQAAYTMGAPQIRNRATIGGNIVSASPAADGVVPLLSLNASLTLIGENGIRQTPLAGFIQGPGRTGLQPGELLLQITIPKRWGKTGFSKLGKRNALAISVVNMAANIAIERGRITSAAIAVGSVGPTAVIPKRAEATLLGSAPGLPVFESAARQMMEEITPIDDVRASAAYRREVSGSMLVDLLRRVAEEE